jgi:hypothetical protein
MSRHLAGIISFGYVCPPEAPMKLRRNKNQHLPLRMTLWFCVVLAFVLALLNQTPLPVNVEFPQEEPVELTRDTPADVVVVIDWNAVRASPATFSGRDFSASWINLFEQEVGPVTIATPVTLNARLLDGARVIILTSSVAKEVPPAITKLLREYVLAGKLLLVVERPEGEMRERFGANGRVGSQRGRKISWVRDLEDPSRQHLLDAKVDIEFVGSTMPKEDATTWMSVDGAPVVYSVPIGLGHVVIVDFDFGEFLVASQQGKPKDDFTLPGSDPTTVDLASFQVGQAFPVADAVERYLVHGIIGRLTEVPAFWPFPAGSDGVVVALHEDHVLGNGGAWMLRYEATRKGASTLVTSVNSGFDLEGQERVEKLGGEVGLLWQMQDTPNAMMESFGIGPVRPFARPQTLEAQVNDFEKNTGTRPTTAQILGHSWTKDWVAPLQAMSSQGIRIDFSYSPIDKPGYRFGTGLPFLALDETGLPLSIRELPVIVPEATDAGPAILDFLTRSQASTHQAITIASRPAAFADFPDIKKFEKWIELFDHIETTNHRLLSANALDTFMRARRASTIRTVVLAPAADAPQNLKVVRVTVESKRGDLELMLPERLGNQVLARVRQKVNRVGDELVSGELETTPADYMGIPVRRVKLESGFNTIDVYYEGK